MVRRSEERPDPGVFADEMLETPVARVRVEEKVGVELD